MINVLYFGFSNSNHHGNAATDTRKRPLISRVVDVQPQEGDKRLIPLRPERIDVRLSVCLRGVAPGGSTEAAAEEIH